MVQTQDPVEALEQRPRKGKEAAKPAPEEEATNGAAAENGHATGDEQVAPVETAPRGIYLVRVPKPPIDESGLKALQAEFQVHVDKLKKMNTVLGKKREEIRELRRQMGEARSLKEESEPEYQEKLNRIKQLKTLRQSYLDKIKEIKDNLQGLDCKSELELDNKIRDLELKISHEALPLREEKQIVFQISKLNAQRSRIKEYDIHKATLVDLESEQAKIKDIIADMDKEFDVIKTERNAANGIKKDIWTKLEKVGGELKELEAEQAEAVAKKNEVLEQLEKQRKEIDASMVDYRANRKLSLDVRDMVAAGQVEEARALATQQVDEWLSKLSTDTAARKDYQKLWAEQRRFAVSELLPGSSVYAQQQAAATKAAPAGKGAAPAKGAAKGAAAPKAVIDPVVSGAQKAKSIIESLLSEASRDAAVRARAAPAYQPDDDDSGDADEEVEAAPAKRPEPVVAKPAAPAAPAKLVTDAAAAAANAFNFKVELPKVEHEEFVPPVVKDEETETEAQRREREREEQRKKAAEAEERKKKREEQAVRRRQQAAETAKRLEEERKERDRQARAAALQAKTQPATDESANESPAPAAAEVAAQRAAAASAAAAKAALEKKQAAVAKRPAKKDPLRPAKKIWEEHQGYIVLAAVLLITLLLIFLYM